MLSTLITEYWSACESQKIARGQNYPSPASL